MTNPNSFKSEVSSADQQAEGRSRQTVARDEAGLVSTAPVEERAVLVGVELQREPSLLTLEDSLDELALLAKTAGVKSVARLTQRLETPNPATLIGSGKLDELQVAVTELGANVVIFDDELSPRQQRELEKTLGEEVKVIDRTALILDIFARHARTREGAVQVRRGLADAAHDAAVLGHARCRVGEPERHLIAGDPAVGLNRAPLRRVDDARKRHAMSAQRLHPVAQAQRRAVLTLAIVFHRQVAERV